MKPLEGLRILTVDAFAPGRTSRSSLADHGAEVIKIEPPGEGDPTRHLGPCDGGEHGVLPQPEPREEERGARPQESAGARGAAQLCESADVFVESFRPGVVERLGVGYEQRARAQPAHRLLLDQRLRPAGPVPRPAGARPRGGSAERRAEHDPRRGRQADDSRAAARRPARRAAGARRRPDGAPARASRPARATTSTSRCTTRCSPARANILGPTLAEKRQPVARHERTTGGSAFYRLYETADGRHLALGGQEMKFVRNLLGALGRPELAPLCEKPGPHQQPVMEFLEKDVPGEEPGGKPGLPRPARRLLRAGEHAARGARGRGRDKLLKDELGRRHLAPPIRFRDEPARRACASRGSASTTRSRRLTDLVAAQADVAQHAVAERVELALRRRRRTLRTRRSVSSVSAPTSTRPSPQTR